MSLIPKEMNDVHVMNDSIEPRLTSRDSKSHKSLRKISLMFRIYFTLKKIPSRDSKDPSGNWCNTRQIMNPDSQITLRVGYDFDCYMNCIVVISYHGKFLSVSFIKTSLRVTKTLSLLDESGDENNWWEEICQREIEKLSELEKRVVQPNSFHWELP